MDSAELLARAERFALDSLEFYRTLPKAMEAQVPGVQSSLGRLDFMEKGRIATDARLKGEAAELCAILTASLQTSRANWLAELAARKRKKRA